MNSPLYPSSRRAVPLVSPWWQMAGVAVCLGTLAGCARRPIVVQTAPPPPPTATVIHTPAPVVAPPPVVGTAAREVVVVKEAPPPPREERPPPPPATGSYTWIPGYWSFRDGRQEWVPGRYEMPPSPGATWVAPRWEREGEGYVFVDGYWRRSN